MKNNTSSTEIVISGQQVNDGNGKAGAPEAIQHKIRTLKGRTEDGKPIWKEDTMTVERKGTKLIVPEGANWADMRKALKEMEESEEQIQTYHYILDCYPLDGMLALQRAINHIYGFSHQSSRGFFGPRPPHMVTIKTGVEDKDVESALYGDFAPPSWEGGSIGVVVDSTHPMAITINGSCKKKFDREVKQIFEVTKQFLKDKSIYRGKAVELDLDYLKTGEFSPDHNAPSFMDVRNKVELILPRDIEFELDSSIWSAIEAPNDFVANGIPLKHGVLLKGRFGTGKSLTSFRTAQICVENDWSYFYLKTPEHFMHAYKLAQLYSPCVLFVEDIDAVTSGERTSFMNAMLETLDGVSAKKSDVITVFTTNNPERIHEAFLRPGRVDTVIEFTPPDAEAAARFVKVMAGSALSDEAVENIASIGEAFAGLVPASISEGIRKAKRIAIKNQRHLTGDGSQIAGSLSSELLITAANVMQRQAEDARGPGESMEAIQMRGLRTFAPGLFNSGEGAEKMGEAVKQMVSAMRGARR